jgi:hypothetical protein
LRQLKTAGTASPVLKAWLAEFDYAVVGDDADEAVLQDCGMDINCFRFSGLNALKQAALPR